MGTSVSTLQLSRVNNNRLPWLSSVLRRRKLMPSTLPLMSMTSREMARLMPSMPVTSSVPATSTQPSELLRKLEVSLRRERRPSPRLRSSPCTRHARTPRTRVASMTLLKSLSFMTKTNNTMIGNELFRLLTNLGEKLTKEEAKGLMKELCEPEDDDGFMPFIPFLEKMCAA